MKGSGKGTIPEKEKTVFWYILAALLLSSMFAMHAVFGKNQAMDRREEIKLEKEISSTLLELGYPGEDADVPPAEGWEQKNEEGGPYWYHPLSSAKLIPAVKPDGKVGYWIYEVGSMRYRLEPQGTFRREK